MTRLTVIHFVALFLLATLARDAWADEPERIVGGQLALPSEFPYQVSLRLYGSHACGGSIITPSHILTAAHCVHNLVPPPFTAMHVVTGTNTIRANGKGRSHKIKNIVKHHGYVHSSHASFINDIAVITLQEPIAINAFQRPINLASRETPANVQAIVSGWGKTSVKGQPSPDLLKAHMKILSSQQCQMQIRERIHDTHICALNQRGIGVCQGDSGGPLAYNNEVIGIVSWAYPCALGRPDVYTKVYRYISFIHDAMK